jgi:preprotein translocase subunit SecG
MFQFLLVVHVIVAVALVGVILMQRSVAVRRASCQRVVRQIF